MSVLQEIKSRFASTLATLSDDPDRLLDMIRPAQDTKFGDFQVNCAMPLQKVLGKPPREIAQQLIDSVDLSDICSGIEIAGPGFINLTVADDRIKNGLNQAVADDRLGVAQAPEPQTIIIDYSSPNVAKPMHVGHIRSTVIGDALNQILRFAGHNVIGDNHLGDWGTQFGMIIYGYKSFLKPEAYQEQPVAELGRLYKRVRKLMDYHDAKNNLPKLQQALVTQKQSLEQLLAVPVPDDKAGVKAAKKEAAAFKAKIEEGEEKHKSITQLITEVESDEALKSDADQHPDVSQGVLKETAKLHSGDEENQKLWHEFLPHCREDIARIYDRLDIKFDYELGESFYHDMLPGVVESLKSKGLCKESDGALCVFLDNYETPMIVQKKDGAFLYSSTDLATIQYREDKWKPDVVLYVVDFRQHEHFAKLFDVARAWKNLDTEFVHVSFGTVLGEDGKPYKTRAGDTVGLEGLLDEAVYRAFQVVSELDDGKKGGQELDDDERRKISEVVGIGALKYADLSQNRASDYKFSYDKMVALKGNTATYLQYSYARVQGIFRKENTNSETIRNNPCPFEFEKPIERSLALQLLMFEEAINDVRAEYKPNLLANYLYETTDIFFKFYDQCPVKGASSDSIRASRLQLCDLVARTIKQGLALLGIGVVEKM